VQPEPPAINLDAYFARIGYAGARTPVGDAWQALYRFAPQEQLLADYQVANWYLSNHPDSHFLHGLIAARVTPDRRYALRNNELAIHYLGGKTERRTLLAAAQLRSILEEEFRLRLPTSPELEVLLDRLARGLPVNSAGELRTDAFSSPRRHK
jgi:arylamine N-acetyltransferase